MMVAAKRGDFDVLRPLVRGYGVPPIEGESEASEMTWARRFRLSESAAREPLAVPLAGAVLGGMLGIAVLFADEHIGAPVRWQYSPSTASTVLSTIIGATARSPASSSP